MANTKETIISAVTVALRTSNSNADLANEVVNLVNMCLEDLYQGVDRKISYDDPLILKACICYAKANYGYDDSADKWESRYQMLKKDLGNYGEYSGEYSNGTK